MGTLRGASILAGFFALTVPLMPVQALLVRVSPSAARRFPHWYHRQVCRLIGVRLSIDGAVAQDKPVLLVSNHTSWLDIPVLSAVAPVSFVAKKEVAGWPFVTWLAKLQRSVFVDRARRGAVGDSTSEIMRRLEAGDTIVLFAEGTSSDGNRVLPFKTSLFAAAKPAAKGDAAMAPDAVVQTLSLVYTRLHGVPFGTRDAPPRRLVRRHGDAEPRLAAPEVRTARRAESASARRCPSTASSTARTSRGAARTRFASMWSVSCAHAAPTSPSPSPHLHPRGARPPPRGVKVVNGSKQLFAQARDTPPPGQILASMLHSAPLAALSRVNARKHGPWTHSAPRRAK